jgi:hypothetical protein
MTLFKVLTKLKDHLEKKSGMETEVAIANDALALHKKEADTKTEVELRMFCLDQAIKNLKNSVSYCAPIYVADEANQYMSYILTGKVKTLQEKTEEIKE